MAKLELTQEELQHLTVLANLPLPDIQAQTASAQLSAILDFVSQLNQVDTAAVDPTAEVHGLKNISVPDQVNECLPQSSVLDSAAKQQAGYVVVKGIFTDKSDV